MKQKFDVTGMTCSACSAHVEKSVAKVPGVRSVTVNLLSNNMAVDYDETASSDAAVIHAVEEAGYGASVHAGAASSRPQAKAAPAADPMAAEIANMKRRLIVSFVFLIPLFYISMGHMMGLPLPAFPARDGKRARLRVHPAAADACRSPTSTANTTRWASRPCSTARPTWIR